MECKNCDALSSDQVDELCETEWRRGYKNAILDLFEHRGISLARFDEIEKRIDKWADDSSDARNLAVCDKLGIRENLDDFDNKPDFSDLFDELLG